MWQAILEDNADFEMFSFGHYVPILLFAITGFWIIKTGISLPRPEDKLKFAFLWSLPGPIMILGWLLFRIYQGSFDITEDLPIHLCNFVSMILPFYFLKPSRIFFGILYFWVMVGTFQALITPGLEHAFPHFWYFRYWVIHCGLIILILYTIIVLGQRPDWHDLKRAFLFTNLYVVFTLGINLMTGANYFYTIQKPDTASLLDILGPWPWYLISGQLMMAAMFSMYLLPFYAIRPQSSPVLPITERNRTSPNDDSVC